MLGGGSWRFGFVVLCEFVRLVLFFLFYYLNDVFAVITGFVGFVCLFRLPFGTVQCALSFVLWFL